MSMEKYSVLMSVYYKEKASYFSEAISSMIDQTIKPDEIVIVKDGPLTEELDKVINQFDSEYPGLFKIITNEQNIGLGLSLQKGILACSNQLIARMDSDDISRKDRIEKQLALFRKNPDLDICGGHIQEFSEKGLLGIRSVPLSNDDIYAYIKRRCPFNHMTVMYKKDAVVKAGNYQHFLYNEDYKLWIDMYLNQCKMANVDDILVDVRVDENLYKRRGGSVYFKSEKAIQDILLKKKMINYFEYLYNVGIRFILQILCPNSLRSLIFRLFARS